METLWIQLSGLDYAWLSTYLFKQIAAADCNLWKISLAGAPETEKFLHSCVASRKWPVVYTACIPETAQLNVHSVYSNKCTFRIEFFVILAITATWFYAIALCLRADLELHCWTCNPNFIFTSLICQSYIHNLRKYGWIQSSN